MELDARKISSGAVLKVDICVVGAGPAGMALAREFMGLKLEVLVLESGGLESEERIQELNEGTVVGDPYAGLRQSRYRQAGGAVALWNTAVGEGVGAKYVPLDSCDFEGREDLPLYGWPLVYSQLEPFYRRSQKICQLGPLAYDGQDWVDKKWPAFALDGEDLTTRVYQFGVRRAFSQSLLRDIRKSENISLCHHATVLSLETQGSGSRINQVKVACLNGRQFQVKASIVVLAAGAIENARILLLSRENGGEAVGNKNGWVGRCFMEHPRDYALTLIPHSGDLFSQAMFYDVHPAQDGTIIGGRIALQSHTIKAARLPNASVTLFPRVKTRTSSPGLATRLLAPLRRFQKNPAVSGYGWSRIRDLSLTFDAFKLLVNIEQRPNPENRIVLAKTKDILGVAQVELHWCWRAQEQADLQRLRKVLASGLEAAGLGQVEIHSDQKPDPNAFHHAGTTRMHDDPRFGVVDSDARVHGVDNLYISGASVFPSAGFANPTLTIVALALRLADHIKQRV